VRALGERVGELGEDKQSQLELGAMVEVYTARSGEFVAQGRVSRAAPYLDPSRRSRSLRVTLAAPANDSIQHRPGLLARALIATGRPELYLRVSEEAVHQGYAAPSSTNAPSHLRVLRGEELVITPVRIVQNRDGQVLFEGDVQVGEQAVARDAGDEYAGR